MSRVDRLVVRLRLDTMAHEVLGTIARLGCSGRNQAFLRRYINFGDGFLASKEKVA